MFFYGQIMKISHSYPEIPTLSISLRVQIHFPDFMYFHGTVMILSFWTDGPGQIVQTLQSDQGLHFAVPSASFGCISLR